MLQNTIEKLKSKYDVVDIPIPIMPDCVLDSELQPVVSDVYIPLW